MLGLFTLLAATIATPQDTLWRFHWQQGQTLTYRAQITTQTSEVIPDGKMETKSTTRMTRRWTVLAVDDAGIATLQSTLITLKMEVNSPSGELLLFDSAAPDKSTPELREQMARLVGAPLATLRVDKRGRVVEVRESKLVAASRFEMELPFTVMLPDVPVAQGQAWDRAYSITVEPPEGTGEKYEARQRYTLLKSDTAAATIAMTTTLKTKPMALADQAPLMQFQPEGEIVFDIKNGRVQSVNLKVNKELQGHQGAGTSYKFQSTYTEQLIAP